ncbi:MAG: hypothetical protein KAI17_18045, partial [Thiotrichaceae bacterium]|nr:hypothetical protein [Thiotrichaceae bacterium]
PNIGMNEMEAFCKAVNDLAKFENTYFQRKNCAVTIAEQELRAAEHTMAQAQIKVSAAKQASAELKH